MKIQPQLYLPTRSSTPANIGNMVIFWPKVGHFGIFYSVKSPNLFLLCLELEQIRDHFYYTNGGHLYSKSGLGFVITPSIAKIFGHPNVQNPNGLKPVQTSWHVLEGQFPTYHDVLYTKQNQPLMAISSPNGFQDQSTYTRYKGGSGFYISSE